MAAKRKKLSYLDVPQAAGAAVAAGVAPAAPVAPVVVATSTPAAASTPAATIPAPAPTALFSALRSNVKRRQRHSLGPCTAFVAAGNRTGKTAALDAIRLALTGKHPVGASAADMRRLAAEGDGAPWAVLSGAQAGASYTLPQGSAKPDHLLSGTLAGATPEALLPQVAWQDLLSMGSTLAREELFRRFGATCSLDAPVGLSEAEAAVWAQALAAASGVTPSGATSSAASGPAAPSAVEQLSSMGSWLRSYKRHLSEERKALEQALDQARRAAQATAEDGVVVGVEHVTAKLEEARAKLRECEAEAARLEAATQVQAQVTQQERARQRQMYARLIAAVKAYHAAKDVPGLDGLLATLQAKWAPSMKSETLETLRAAHEAAAKQARLAVVLSGMRQNLAAGCVCCGAPAPGNILALQAEADQWEHHTATLEAEARQALREAEKLCSAATAEYEAEVVKTKREHTHQVQMRDLARGQAVTLRDEFLRLFGEKALEEVAAEAAAGQGSRQGSSQGSSPADEEAFAAKAAALAVATLNVERFTAQNRVIFDLEERLRVLQMLSSLEADSRTLEAKWDAAKSIEHRVQAMLDSLVASVRTQAETAVNAWMPPGFRASLELASGERSVCRWTVIGADGQPHPRHVMSGAEWATLVVAVACAWSEGQPLRVLLLDDSDLGALAPDTLRVMLEHLGRAVREGRLSQVFIAWSRPEEIPADWHVVYVDALEPRAALPS